MTYTLPNGSAGKVAFDGAVADARSQGWLPPTVQVGTGCPAASKYAKGFTASSCQVYVHAGFLLNYMGFSSDAGLNGKPAPDADALKAFYTLVLLHEVNKHLPNGGSGGSSYNKTQPPVPMTSKCDEIVDIVNRMIAKIQPMVCAYMCAHNQSPVDLCRIWSAHAAEYNKDLEDCGAPKIGSITCNCEWGPVTTTCGT